MKICPISCHFDRRFPNMPSMNDPYTGKPLDQLTLELGATDQ